MKKAIYIITMFLILNSSFFILNSDAQWYSVENGSFGNVYDMIFKDQNTGWHVIEGKALYRTTNGGFDWICIDMPYIDSLNFCSHIIHSSDTLWASINNAYNGNSSKILKSINSGLNWSVINTNLNGQIIRYSFIKQNLIYGYLKRSNPDKFYVVKSTDTGINWSVVFDFTGFLLNEEARFCFVNDSIGFISYFNRKIYKTTNYGNNWSNIYHDTTNTQITYSNFINAYLGFLVKDYSRTYRTTDGGYSWDSVLSYPLLSFAFDNESTGYSVTKRGTNIVYKTTDTGKNWFNIYEYSDPLRTRYFTHIYKKGNTIFVNARSAGSIFKSTNNGLNWVDLSVYDRTGGAFGTISFANANTGFIGGDYLTLMRTTNGGDNWTKLNVLGNPFISNFSSKYIRKIQFVDEKTGYLLVFFSDHSDTLFYKTTNSGANWNLLKTNINSGRNFHFINSNTGWATNDTNIDIRTYSRVFKTTNGGSNFVFKALITTPAYDIAFYDNLYGYMACQDILNGPNLWKTTDGGESWQGYNLGLVSSVSIIDRNIAFATSYTQGIYKTTNGGANWFMCFNNPQSWEKIKFVNNQIGFALSYNRNIFYTTNQGSSWNYSNIGSTIPLNDICFTNQSTGFAVGVWGKIYKTNNTGGIVSINPISTEIPKDFCLHQNYPNPFNPVTKINFELPIQKFVSLKIYDITGREIQTLVNEIKQAGYYTVDFNGPNLSSGVYFYKIQSGNFVSVKRMVLVK
ncbi:MAG: T9SS type A sorting domain-containing protein [Candidatus Kapaibacterium sp.]